MGSVARLEIPNFMAEYSLKHFVETGTGRGDSLAHVQTLPFQRLLSCEIEAALHQHSVARFAKDNRIDIWHAASAVFLEHVCTQELPPDEPALFFLDAHFPGADYGLRNYGAEQDESLRLPLHHELDIIQRYRLRGADVILVDDLRLYTDGPFVNGNLPANVRDAGPSNRSAQFIRDIFADTHDTTFLYADEGYALIRPKSLLPTS